MMSPRPITGRPACGRNRGDSHPKTLRGPVGKERPAGPRSHLGTHAVIGVARHGRRDFGRRCRRAKSPA